MSTELLKTCAKSLTGGDQPVSQADMASIKALGLRHIGIIMDGNGRWAASRGLSRSEGHRQGVIAARRAIEAAREFGLSYLTLYSFSMENWRRSKREVTQLMALLDEFFASDLHNLVKQNVRIVILGDKLTLPTDVRRLVHRAEQLTQENTGQTLQIAFNYGSRNEIVRAAQRIAHEAIAGRLRPEELDESRFSGFLDTKQTPDPELIIRTSGEIRISNFLLWQAAYAEFVFLDAFWPEFDRALFVKAVQDFAGRNRRFGGHENMNERSTV